MGGRIEIDATARAANARTTAPCAATCSRPRRGLARAALLAFVVAAGAATIAAWAVRARGREPIVAAPDRSTFETHASQADMPTRVARAVARPEAPAHLDASDSIDAQLAEPQRTREERREKDFYADFIALGKDSPTPLEAAAETVLAGNGPDCEKVALLRALHAAGSSRAYEFFVAAIVSLPDGTSSHGESVPRFAMQYLTERIARDAPAKSAVERAVASAPPEATEVRRLGTVALARAASASELWTVAARLAAERDPRVRQAGVDALAHGPHAELAEAALLRFGLVASPKPAIGAGESTIDG
jgi:hypothetical protein